MVKKRLSPLVLLFCRCVCISPDSTFSNTAAQASRETLQGISILPSKQEYNNHVCDSLSSVTICQIFIFSKTCNLKDTTIDFFLGLQGENRAEKKNDTESFQMSGKCEKQMSQQGFRRENSEQVYQSNSGLFWKFYTWILSWWWGLTFFFRGAESDRRPPWSTWKRRSSLPLTMWKEKGGPFFGVSLSVTTSWRMVLPTDSPSC